MVGAHAFRASTCVPTWRYRLAGTLATPITLTGKPLTVTIRDTLSRRAETAIYT